VYRNYADINAKNQGQTMEDTRKKIASIAVFFASVMCGNAFAQTESWKPVETRPAERQEWVIRTPDETDAQVFYRGISPESVRNESTARSAAQQDARARFAEFLDAQIEQEMLKYMELSDTEEEGFMENSRQESRLKMLTKAVASKLKENDSFTEIYAADGQRRYKVYVLMSVKKADLNNAVDEWGKQAAAEVAAEIKPSQSAETQKRLQDMVSRMRGGKLSGMIDIDYSAAE
jgi:hypothetical protein